MPGLLIGGHVAKMSKLIHVEEDEPHTDVDFAFAWRDVQVRDDQWVTDEYDIYEVLGRGKFGEVKRCTNRSNRMDFAAKFIATPTVQDREEVHHELTITKKLQHKRLLQIYDAFSIGTNMCLVLEVIMGGELFDRVICEDFVLTEKACMCFMRQVCDGVSYMHSNNIIHLDMKPENILCLSRTGNRIKIIDFGLARVYEPKKDMRVLFGTPEFMAPEVVNYDPISFATDMWSIGVITYVLLSGLSPFMGDSDADTLTNVIKCDYDFNYDDFEDISEAAKDFIENLLIVDKKKRLSADQCLEHPWLKPVTRPKCTALELNKDQLHHYVYRRKWQKAIYGIIALRRMGVDLQKLNELPTKPALPPKPRVVNIGQFFNKGKDNFNKKDNAFNAIMKHCNKTSQQCVIGCQKPKKSKPKLAPKSENVTLAKEAKKTENNVQKDATMSSKSKNDVLDYREKDTNTKSNKTKFQEDVSLVVPPHVNKGTKSDVKTDSVTSKIPNSPTISSPKAHRAENVQNNSTNVGIQHLTTPVSVSVSKSQETPMIVDGVDNIVINKNNVKNAGSVDNTKTIDVSENGVNTKNKINALNNADNSNKSGYHGNIHTPNKIDNTQCDNDAKNNKNAETVNCHSIHNVSTDSLSPTPMEVTTEPERRSIVHKRTSSNASCGSDSSDATRDENLNRVLRKRPNMCSVLDRVRAFECGQNENTKPPIAPREESVDISNLKKTGQNARKWQKGNDRYIVVNKIQDTLKFFTVDDQRELISSGFSRSRENSPNIAVS